MNTWDRNYFSNKLRKCAGDIAEARSGREIREILTEGFILLSDAVREEEIPTRSLLKSSYLKGAFVGSVLTEVIIIIWLIVNMQG